MLSLDGKSLFTNDSDRHFCLKTCLRDFHFSYIDAKEFMKLTKLRKSNLEFYEKFYKQSDGFSLDSLLFLILWYTYIDYYKRYLKGEILIVG